MTNFIKDQQQIAREKLGVRVGVVHSNLISSTDLDTLTKQIITNTINHLLAGLEDKQIREPKDHVTSDLNHITIGHNQANAKIRQLGADIISEVS